MPVVLHRMIRTPIEVDYSCPGCLLRIIGMPEISRFLGVVITMFYNDREPAHFHAVYGERVVTISIHNEKVTGEFPVRQLRLLLEWTRLHRDELLEDWELAKQRKPLKRIAPLG